MVFRFQIDYFIVINNLSCLNLEISGAILFRKAFDNIVKQGKILTCNLVILESKSAKNVPSYVS